MTREEAMKIIKENRPNYRDWQEEFDEALDRLKQPITLAEFLGWEEGEEYRRGGNILKVEANHLLDKRPSGHFYNTNCTTAELIDLRNATKYEPKYYAKIKGWELVKDSKFIYWSADREGENILINDKTIFKNYHVALTKPEWAKLGINDSNADFEEVKE